MNRKWSLLWWGLGELLIIACFLHFGRNMEQPFQILDIIISSIIFSLYFIDILFPLVNLKDKSAKKVGSIGIRWVFTFIYSLTAIGAMLVFSYALKWELTSQLLIHGILLFFMTLGMWGAFSATKKAEAVYSDQTDKRLQMEEIKRNIGVVKSKLEKRKEVPATIMNGIKNLQEDIRYVSPANAPEAFDLEIRILSEIKSISRMLDEEPADFEKMLDTIQNCSRLFIERKQVYSN